MHPQVILILNDFMRLFMIMLSLILFKVEPHKDDRNYGFKSDHIINGSNKQFIMFNAMLTHGLDAEDLLLSTIISISKDNRD